MSFHLAVQALPEQEKSIVVAKGVPINVRLSEGIFEVDERTRPFEARAARSVKADGVVVIPAGSRTFGSVRSGSEAAEAVLRLNGVEIDSMVIEVVTNPLCMELPPAGFRPGTVLVFELARPVEFPAF